MNALRIFNRRVVSGISNQCKRLMSTELENVVANAEKPKGERSVNKVTLLGRVGKEGEIRGTTEHPCLIFPMATSFTYKKASTGEYLTKTDWHRICVFQPGLRHVASSINKGDRILVEGSLSHQRFMEDNRTVNITSIIAEDIIFLTRRRNREDETQEAEEM